MIRNCVRRASEESGVPAELLTTHADILGGPYGLPDAPPYNEVVCLVDGVAKDDPMRWKWEDYLWKCYLAEKKRC